MLSRTGKVLSTRAHILILVGIIVAPMLVLVGILATNFAAAERQRMEESMTDQARVIASEVDRELSGLEYTLIALANAPVLKDGDLDTFQSYIQTVAEARDASIVLRDTESNVIANSGIPRGQPIPQATSLRSADTEPKRLGKTVVSSLFTGLVAQRPNVAVVMPVFADDRLKYFLSLSIAARELATVLERAALQAEQTAVIVDRNNVVVARSTDHDDYVGTRARFSVADLDGKGGQTVRSAGFGEPTHIFHAPSALSGWTVAVTVPEAALSAPSTQSMQIMGSLGVALVGLSLASSLFLARQFSIPIEKLATGAAALGQHQSPAPLKTSVREIRNVWEILARVAEELRSRTEERDRAESALRSFNARLEEEIAARTAELTETNAKLLREMAGREESEGQLRQIQKLEAIGQLTGGIAHDFNNMLAAILGGLQLIQRRVDTDQARLHTLLDGVIESTQRAAQLTRRLLAFARQQALSPKPVDVNKLILGMSELLRRTIPELISMETVLAAGVWRIHADANQLENALLNLAVNARDAMPEGGRLTVETANAYLDEGYAAQHPEVVPGQYVLIAVTDTGRGMSPDVVARAFDPFFTTKQDGEGTGLGLSQVHGFLKQSGGHVKIYSEPGNGTTVKLYLPRFLGPDEATPDLHVHAEPRGGSDRELILVVEDDDRVRKMSIAMLDELGYPVLAAENALEALRLLDANPAIKLLLTDVVMPEMNGRKLADEARHRFPHLKVLFTTGYTRNAVVHNGILDAGVHMLGKPFTLDELARMVRIALDA